MERRVPNLIMILLLNPRPEFLSSPRPRQKLHVGHTARFPRKTFMQSVTSKKEYWMRIRPEVF